MRRRPRAGALVTAWSTLLVALVMVAAPGPVAAQEGETTTTAPQTSIDPESGIVRGTADLTPSTVLEGEACFGDIVQRPGCGAEPAHPGARGGWQQSLVFFGILGTIVVIGLVAWRSGRSARAASSRPEHQRSS